jgi:hypothetical protein
MLRVVRAKALANSSTKADTSSPTSKNTPPAHSLLSNVAPLDLRRKSTKMCGIPQTGLFYVPYRSLPGCEKTVFSKLAIVIRVCHSGFSTLLNKATYRSPNNNISH